MAIAARVLRRRYTITRMNQRGLGEKQVHENNQE